MSKMKNKLKDLKKDEIKQEWEKIENRQGLSTKEKLEKLVKLSMNRVSKKEPVITKAPLAKDESVFIVKEFQYPIDTLYGKVKLEDWLTITASNLSILTGDDNFERVDPKKLVFFDTETTGLSGGTGTIPFLIGFGYFSEERFKVKVFILNDLYGEEAFLDEIDSFLREHDFSGTVTFNGKSFDFPLMETRYILYRKRFPLLRLAHLDFLYPARTLWKHTYESRRLSYLGEILLGLSREEDIESSQIPALYFSYLRNRSFSMIEKVIEHNALDILGLAALVLLGVKYLEDSSDTSDEGEILGTAMLFEKSGDLKKAKNLYFDLKECAIREDVKAQAIKRSSFIMKKQKLFNEAVALWEMLSPGGDKNAARELSMHFEHREKNYTKALEAVQKGLESVNLTTLQKKDFEKRLLRLNKKVKAIQKEEEA